MSTSANSRALMRLMTWLSPAFPIGGFSYSHGLEAAIASGLVTDREELKDWLIALISSGSIHNDVILLALTCRAESDEQTRQYAATAQALAGSKERYLETMTQGNAFMTAAAEWLPHENNFDASPPLPVAVGLVARTNKINPETVCIAFLQSFIGNQIQAALRLMPLGQSNGLWVQRQIEEHILRSAKHSSIATIDDLGSNTVNAEIMAMNHETLQPRIFRT